MPDYVYWILLAVATFQLAEGLISLFGSAPVPNRSRTDLWAQVAMGLGGMIIFGSGLAPEFAAKGSALVIGLICMSAGFAGKYIGRFRAKQQ